MTPREPLYLAMVYLLSAEEKAGIFHDAELVMECRELRARVKKLYDGKFGKEREAV